MLKPIWRDTNLSNTLCHMPYSSVLANNKFELLQQELYEYTKKRFRRLLLNSIFAIEKKREYVSEYKIGATWIGESNKIAHQDYDRELDESILTNIIKWDDSKYNKLSVGDYFGFIDARKEIRILNIYKIIKILGPEYRRDEWSQNGYTTGYSDTHSRNCIILDSNIIQSVDWKEYIKSVSYKKQYLQGTMNIRDSPLFTKLI